MVTRRQVLLATAGVMLGPRAARAQPTGKIPRIGYVTSGTQSGNVKAFDRGLRDVGHVVGQTVVVDYRFGEGHADRVPALVEEVLRLGPDVIFAASPYVIRVALQRTSTVPIVGVDLESDPIALGWIKSLARPAGNLTGFFLDMPELGGKQLQFLAEVLPKFQRVGVMWDEQIARSQFNATEEAAQGARLDVQSLPFRNSGDLKGLVENARTRRADALVILSSPVVFQNLPRLGQLTLGQRLPAISIFPQFAEAGGLMGYGPDLLPLFQQAAQYVDRVLKGARPADLPIQRPAVFDLAVNLKTARALGLTISESLIARAHHVIR